MKGLAIMRKLRDWWRLDGKILAYQILILGLFLGPVLKSIPLLKDWLPDPKYVLMFFAASMFLLLQIMMALLGERVEDVKIVNLHPTAPEFAKAIRQSKKLDVAFSSTETLFPFIQDALLASDMDCRVLLRNPPAGSNRLRNKLLDYEERWKSLGATNPKCRVKVRYCNNTAFRLLVLDDTEAYFGFYRVDSNRLRGHTEPMLHLKSGASELSNYFLAIARNRFDATWNAGSETIGERTSLV